jgi:hypothetical protein
MGIYQTKLAKIDWFARINPFCPFSGSMVLSSGVHLLERTELRIPRLEARIPLLRFRFQAISRGLFSGNIPSGLSAEILRVIR